MVVEHECASGKRHSVFGIARRCSRISFWPRFLMAFGAIFISGFVSAQPVSKEYQVKAAFLFNFAQFVQWPESTFTNSAEPFNIGILGDDPFGPALEQMVRGESIHGHSFVIVRSRRVQDLEHCEIVFITKVERGHVGDDLARLSGKRILTVSELPGFASHGGDINFFLEGSKVRFEINPAAAQHDGLKISSQLLNLGKIVEPELSKDGS
jgi:hypothetical protein